MRCTWNYKVSVLILEITFPTVTTRADTFLTFSWMIISKVLLLLITLPASSSPQVMITLCFKIANTPTPPKNKQEIFLWRIMLVKNICLLYKNAPTRCRGHCSSRLSKKGKSLKSIKKKLHRAPVMKGNSRHSWSIHYTDRDFFISLRQIYLSRGYSFSISVFRKCYSTVPLTTPPTQLGRALWGALQPSFLPFL